MQKTLLLVFVLLSTLCTAVLQGQENYETVTSFAEAEDRLNAIRNRSLFLLFEENIDQLKQLVKTIIVVDMEVGDPDTIKTFSVNERLLYGYWTKQWQYILDNHQHFQADRDLYRFDDSLYQEIARFTLKNHDQITTVIEATSEAAEQKDFLRLYVDYLIANTGLTTISKNRVLNQAEKFIERYPESNYRPYIKNNVHLNYKNSNISIGFGLVSGGMINTSSLNNYFGSFIPIGGEFTFAYKRIRLDINFSGSLASNLKSSFEFNGKWQEGDRYTQATGTGAIGFEMIKRQSNVFYPYAGITTTNISSFVRDDVAGETNVKLSSFPGYHTGLAWEKRFSQNKDFTNYRERFIADYSDTYWIIKAKAGVIFPEFESESEMFSGEIIYLMISVGILTDPAVNVKK